MGTIVHSVRTSVLIGCLLLCSLAPSAQSITSGDGRYEVGLGLGPLFFLGDLGGNHGVGKTFVKDVNIPLTKMAKGLYVNVYPAEWIGFRAAINSGRLEGDDMQIEDKGGDERFRKDRNLNFTSSLLEAYLALEVYPTVFFERYDGLQGKFRPYGLIGVGAFKFNPQGRYHPGNGTEFKLVDLKPLRLEGQGMAEYPDRKEYSTTAMAIPMGVGFKYYLKDNMYVGMEVLHRITNSDYVDDVSTNYIDNTLFANYLTPEQAAMANQLYYREGYTPGQPGISRPLLNEQRGDPTENDSYFSTILRFGWRLNNWNSPNGRAIRQLRCPAYY